MRQLTGMPNSTVYTKESEDELIKRARRGDRQAFTTIVKQYHGPLLRMIIRFTNAPDLSHDIVQDTFLRVFEKLEMFEGRSSFKSWLFQIAINMARSTFRNGKTDLKDLDPVQNNERNSEVELLWKQTAVSVRKAVQELPQRQKEAVILRVFEELSFKEIAQVMTCPYDTAKANYRHGMIRLGQVLQGEQAVLEWMDKEVLERGESLTKEYQYDEV